MIPFQLCTLDRREQLTSTDRRLTALDDNIYHLTHRESSSPRLAQRTTQSTSKSSRTRLQSHITRYRREQPTYRTEISPTSGPARVETKNEKLDSHPNPFGDILQPTQRTPSFQFGRRVGFGHITQLSLKGELTDRMWLRRFVFGRSSFDLGKVCKSVSETGATCGQVRL